MAEKYKYLVRQLTLIDGGAYQRLSLQYVNMIEGKLEVFPFDVERAGYMYVPELTLVNTPGGWKETDDSVFIG